MRRIVSLLLCGKSFICIIFSCSGLTVNVMAEPMPDDRLSKLTKEVDPFDRLAAWPADQRAIQAIDLCLKMADSLAEMEAGRLKDVSVASLSKKQAAHLLSSVLLIIGSMNTASAIQSDFNPKLSPDTADKLARIQAAVKTLQERIQKDGFASKLSEYEDLIKILSQAQLRLK